MKRGRTAFRDIECVILNHFICKRFYCRLTRPASSRPVPMNPSVYQPRRLANSANTAESNFITLVSVNATVDLLSAPARSVRDVLTGWANPSLSNRRLIQSPCQMVLSTDQVVCGMSAVCSQANRPFHRQRQRT